MSKINCPGFGIVGAVEQLSGACLFMEVHGPVDLATVEKVRIRQMHGRAASRRSLGKWKNKYDNDSV